MNILLVDDNQFVLDGLLDGIDFETLGFEGAYTARSAAKAKKIMEEKKIEIVITDIEMPNGTGLELLEWINQNYPETVTLFCTSFADFNYAREAVRLHCFDYYVKPIQYAEFAQHVMEAVKEAKRLEHEKKNQEYGEYWKENQWNIKVDFWYKYLYRLGSITEKDLQKEINVRKLDYSMEEKIDICIVKMEKTYKVQLLTEEADSFMLRNIAEEIFSKGFYSLEDITVSDNNSMTVILRKRRIEAV